MDWMDTRQVASMTGFAPGTLRQWRYLGGRGPGFVRVNGRAVRYRREVVLAWMREQVQVSA